VFLATFLYAIGFIGGFATPTTLDGAARGPLGAALAINAGLLAVFAVQHSVMARPWFKRRWTRIVPPAVERSTYVLAASLVVALMLWQWRPLPETIWSVQAGWARAVLWTLYAAGWAILVSSTFQIGHFDLFGLRQALARARHRAYNEPGFRQPLFYRLVRHPIMVGFLVAFWAAPDMSVGRLLFAATASAYILVAVRFEEHDLRRELGDRYERYADEVPRFVPRVPAAAVERAH
jgi:protein-S-isoprenylcysteine O-methyltransferase Ste14